jgi:hypothetical protein
MESPADSSQFETEVTLFWKKSGVLTKRIGLDQHGKLISSGAECVMFDGNAFRRSIKSAKELADFIETLDDDEAVALGRLKPEYSRGVSITTKRRLENAPAGTVARTADFLHFAEGRPGWLLLDIDQKGMPEDVARTVEADGGFWNTLCRFFPPLNSVERVTRSSTSSGIVNTQTGERFPGSGGMHIYFLVQDAADIPRALNVIVDRLWLSGLGWYVVSKSGQALTRTLVDGSVGRPERLVFEGGPVVVPPLAQDKDDRRPRDFAGIAINTRDAFPDLSPSERGRLTTLQGEARARIHDSLRSQRAAYLKERSHALTLEKGLSQEQAERTIASSQSNVLLPDFVLEMDDPELGKVTVREIMDDPDRFAGETLADPHEGTAYGVGKAMVMRRHTGDVFINSFAHGGMQYELRLDRKELEARLLALESSAILPALRRLVSTAHFEVGDKELLVDVISKEKKIGKRPLKDVIKATLTERTLDRRRGAQAMAPPDGRPSFPAPDTDGELGSALRQLDEVLCQSTSAQVPMRNSIGKLVRVRVMRGQAPVTTGLSDGATSQLEPPSSGYIEEADIAQATLMIEDHVRYFRVKDDVQRTVRLPLPFVSAYLAFPGSNLPKVAAVSTAPVISPVDGAPLSGTGLDRRTGVYYAIDPALLACVPSEADAHDDAVREAYRFLRDEWLCDVSTSNEGMAVAIALALTLIQRIVLTDGRPAFFISASQRGGGKTTLANMVTAAVFGRSSPTAPWARDDEERRKAILGYLLSGAGAIVWDNIYRGASVASSVIERALTSSEYIDRVLGSSQTVTVPNLAVMIFTGNAISPMGDMASRSLLIEIDVDRLDPEDRDFKHPDPIGWTIANRARILRALYTILIGNPYLRKDTASRRQPRTRFKTWWMSIGAAVEHASELAGDQTSFSDMFKANDAVDEEAESATDLVVAIKGFMRGEQFSAGDLAHQYQRRCDDPAGRTFRFAVEAFSGRQIEHVISARRLAKLLKKVTDRPLQIGKSILKLTVKDKTRTHMLYQIVEVRSSNNSRAGTADP